MVLSSSLLFTCFSLAADLCYHTTTLAHSGGLYTYYYAWGESSIFIYQTKKGKERSMSDSGAGAALGASSLILGCVGLLAMGFFILVFWRIFSKAGFSGAMSLLLLVPIGNIIVICMLAFGRWPIHDELQRLRMTPGGGAAYPPFPPQQQPYPYPPQQQPPYPPQPGYPRY